MSQPPGTPDPNDPWGSPAGQPGGPPEQPSAQPGYPPPYGYSPYGYGQPPATNGKAIAAMWTGIGALVLSLCCA